MRILVACEFSGIVRDAFLARGHDAYSCDLRESLSPSDRHVRYDVEKLLWFDGGPSVFARSLDLVIAHPPCTYLCLSGVHWLGRQPGRVALMEEAARFFRSFLDLANALPALRLCIENPIPHKRAQLGPYAQIVQPWMFGHPERKATCLWLRNLPELQPTNIVEGKHQTVARMGEQKHRAQLRSITFSGLAQAMAEQWG